MKITRLTPNDYEYFYSLRLASLEECPEEFATDADAWKNAPRETINKLLVNSEDRYSDRSLDRNDDGAEGQ
jgi:hypothetical protein